MTIRVSDLFYHFEEYAPQALAEEWDNVGLLLGDMEKEIKRILVCLDITAAVAREAVELKADMIISHHPLIFKGIKSIQESTPKGHIIYSLIKNNISVFCAHTNLDVAMEGVNDQLAHCIGLQNIKDLKEYKVEKVSGKLYGLGKYGDLPKQMNLSDFISHVKHKLSVEHLRIIGNRNGDIKTAAIFCGSFDEDYNSFIRSKADILLTGDLKYHVASDMKELGLCVIDAGHFSTERVIVPSLVENLCKKFPVLEVIGSKKEIDPFKFT